MQQQKSIKNSIPRKDGKHVIGVATKSSKFHEADLNRLQIDQWKTLDQIVGLGGPFRSEDVIQ